MDISLMCRICLAEGVVMYSIFNTKLQQIYEKLTVTPFLSDDGRPLQICYLCYARLRNCTRLQTTCLKSEELFTHMLTNAQSKPKPLEDGNLLRIVHPLIHLSSVPEQQELNEMTRVEVKEEHVEGTLVNILDEKPSIKSTGQIKAEDIDVEDDDASDYRKQTAPADDDLAVEPEDPCIELKKEQSIQATELGFGNIEVKTEEDAISDSSISFAQTSGDISPKPVKNVKNTDLKCIEISAPGVKKLRLPVYNKKKTDAEIHTIDQYVVNESEGMDKTFYKCDKCDKYFNLKHNLFRHIRLHADPYKCDRCEQVFNKKRQLTHHVCVQTVHKLYN